MSAPPRRPDRGSQRQAAARKAMVAVIRARLPELPTPALYQLSGILERMLGEAEVTEADYRLLESAADSRSEASKRRV